MTFEEWMIAIECEDWDFFSKGLAKNPEWAQKQQRRTTPLMKAAEKGSVKMVKKLLGHGASGLDQDVSMNDALKIALKNQQWEAASVLIPYSNVHNENMYNENALIIAWSGKERTEECQKVIRQLIEAGVDVNKQDNTGKSLLIRQAVMESEHGEEEPWLDMLIKAGADLELKDSTQRTALLRASLFGALNNCKRLIEAGARWDLKISNGKNVLILAVESERVELVNYWIQKGVNLEDQDALGYTALSKAVSLNAQEIVQTLIEAGANLKHQTKKGADVWTLAEKHNAWEVLRFLNGLKEKEWLEQVIQDDKKSTMVCKRL